MTYAAEDLRAIERHLADLDALDAFPPNRAMLDRLWAGLADVQDLNFYEHESIERRLMSSGLDARTAHLLTLERQGIAYEPGYEARLYHPTVILAYRDYFNPAACGERTA